MNINESQTASTSKHFESPGNLSPSEIADLKRRSSSRSIKRKKFDDEIVNYGISANQLCRSRVRTQSQSHPTVVASDFEAVKPPTPLPPAPVSAPPVPKHVPVPFAVTSPPIIVSSVSLSAPPTMGKHGLNKFKPQKSRAARRRTGHQINTKDLGRWKPMDDFALVVGVQQTNDLKTVHRGVKFSCKFTLQDIQSRWNSLLYDEQISRLSIAAMQNLHPELVEVVQRKALFSAQEEELLGSVKSGDNPTLEEFQELLNKNTHIFYPSRTAKALFNHWQLMKQYTLLPDQNVQPLPKAEQIQSFSDVEEQINDNELSDFKDEHLEIELAAADRRSKMEIRHLENELSRWAVLVDSLTVAGIPLITPEFDNQTLAVLRGRLVRYLMRSREITFGRQTKDNNVDVDLSLEGVAIKVSRKQGTIKLRSNGDFFVSNDGKHTIFVDGVPVLSDHKARLNNNSVLEVAELRFVFLINYDLINAIRHESAKLNMPLN